MLAFGRNRNRPGKMSGFYELILAVTALERGCKVATLNAKRFARIGGLRVIQPK